MSDATNSTRYPSTSLLSHVEVVDGAIGDFSYKREHLRKILELVKARKPVTISSGMSACDPRNPLVTVGFRELKKTIAASRNVVDVKSKCARVN